MASRTVALDWRALESAIEGHVVLPDRPAYESLRAPPIARFDDGFLTFAETAGPEAIVLCPEPGDVSSTIDFAHSSGLETATRSGGQCFAGHSSRAAS